jgi:hypothetical protein
MRGHIANLTGLETLLLSDNFRITELGDPVTCPYDGFNACFASFGTPSRAHKAHPTRYLSGF